MPSVLPPSTVLVTGASGFSAAWVVDALLKDGYRVRGTVRSQAKAQYLKPLFEQYLDRFETVIVPDIAKAHAFDDVLDDVSGVVHIAATVSLTAGNENEIMSANVEGVGHLMESMKTHGRSVKRFVYMSSAKALLGNPQLDYVYGENDWNDKAVALVEEQGSKADGESAYAASKVLAERAIIKFTEDADVAWDATRIVPVWIYGPIIHDCKSVDDLNLSTKAMYQYLTSPADKTLLQGYCTDYIDVRDVAQAFVAALRTEAAGGRRFVLDAGAVTYQNLYDAVHEITPVTPQVPYGDPSAEKFSFKGAFCDSTPAKEILHLKDFIGIGVCARDTLASFYEKGLLGETHM